MSDGAGYAEVIERIHHAAITAFIVLCFGWIGLGEQGIRPKLMGIGTLLFYGAVLGFFELYGSQALNLMEPFLTSIINLLPVVVWEPWQLFSVMFVLSILLMASPYYEELKKEKNNG